MLRNTKKTKENNMNTSTESNDLDRYLESYELLSVYAHTLEESSGDCSEKKSLGAISGSILRLANRTKDHAIFLVSLSNIKEDRERIKSNIAKALSNIRYANHPEGIHSRAKWLAGSIRKLIATDKFSDKKDMESLLWDIENRSFNIIANAQAILQAESTIMDTRKF